MKYLNIPEKMTVEEFTKHYNKQKTFIDKYAQTYKDVIKQEAEINILKSEIQNFIKTQTNPLSIDKIERYFEKQRELQEYNDKNSKIIHNLNIAEGNTRRLLFYAKSNSMSPDFIQ